MNTIGSKQLVEEIALSSGLTQPQVALVILNLQASILDHIRVGDRVNLNHIGIFTSILRDRKNAHNPKTLEKIKVSPYKTVRLKPSIKAKRYLNY